MSVQSVAYHIIQYNVASHTHADIIIDVFILYVCNMIRCLAFCLAIGN